MELPVIHLYTHDSIGVGEDGPTHQPIEQIASLRAMPGLIDLRPGDANEVVEAWRVIMQLRHDPVALILSRQAMPTLDRERVRSGVRGRPWRLHPRRRPRHHPRGDPDRLRHRGRPRRRRLRAAHRRRRQRPRRVHAVHGAVRPARPPSTARHVLPPSVTARVVIEQGSAFGLDRWAGTTGHIIAMRTFGSSAPLKDLQDKFGFTPEAVHQAARNQLARGAEPDTKRQ